MVLYLECIIRESTIVKQNCLELLHYISFMTLLVPHKHNPYLIRIHENKFSIKKGVKIHCLLLLIGHRKN